MGKYYEVKNECNMKLFEVESFCGVLGQQFLRKGWLIGSQRPMATESSFHVEEIRRPFLDLKLWPREYSTTVPLNRK